MPEVFTIVMLLTGVPKDLHLRIEGFTQCQLVLKQLTNYATSPVHFSCRRQT